jgi:general stress protein YciG
MQEKKRTKRKEPQVKSIYQQVIDGDLEPEGSQKGWNNLQPEKYNFSVMDKEKLREISRKGAQAVNKLHGEKKTAKQALENILTLKVSDEIIAGADLDPAIAAKLKRDNPDATLYDLIQIVAAGRAVGGNIKAAEYIRDTYGDKPVDKMEVTAEIMTDKDRALLEKISRRLDDPGLVIAKDVT